MRVSQYNSGHNSSHAETLCTTADICIIQPISQQLQVTTWLKHAQTQAWSPKGSLKPIFLCVQKNKDGTGRKNGRIRRRVCLDNGLLLSMDLPLAVLF